MPLPPNYVQALVTYSDVNGDAGTQELTELFNSLFAKVNAGQGKTLVAHAINGKSYGWAVNTTVEEAFGALGEALRQINPGAGGALVQSYADFSSLQR